MKSALNLFGIKKGAGDGGSGGGLDEFLNALPEQLGYSVSFRKSEASSSGIHYEIEGEEVDSFVSNSSEILDALSHLAMRVQRKTEGLANEPVAEESKENFRITFDAGGFRERKTQELRDMAAEKRQRVMESGGKPSYVPALSPSDRKVIHTHLADLGDVVSESIGKGNFKRIRIRLKDESKRTYQPQPNEGGEERRAANGHSGNGGGRGGRGGRARGNNGFRNNGQEVDGNRVETTPVFEEHHVDENIGNRLSPGEDSPFKKTYGTNNNSGHSQNE